jgi:hypothetical protein
MVSTRSSPPPHGRVDDTFFTPWHAALYSGYLATALLLVGRAAWGRAHGAAWLPYVGYFVALGLTVGIGRSTHLWTAIVVFSAVVGWLMSYIALPPRWEQGVRLT